MSEFSERLQSLMRQRNMTQRQLAERINVTEASMSRYCNGERMPRLNTVANMATALHTTSDFLLGRDTEHDESFDFAQVKRLLARHASSLSAEEKNELINALFAKE
jgi:transcriptional regulator with XRE-family HTH domain